MIQFNWIFILIVGVIFVIFFTTMAVKYKSVQEEKTTFEILNNLDTALTALQASPFKTTTELTLPLTTKINCIQNRTIVSIGNRNHITNNLIAAPSALKGPIKVTSSQLNLPFKITTLYYLFPTTKQYVWVYDETQESFIQEVQQDLSLLENIRYEQAPIQRQPGITYIYLTQGSRNDIEISPERQVLRHPGEETLTYYNKEMLYAFLFSQDAACLSNQIQEKITNAIQLYQKKIQSLAGTGCDYGTIQTKILQLEEQPTIQLQQEIINANKQVINQNCPAVF